MKWLYLLSIFCLLFEDVTFAQAQVQTTNTIKLEKFNNVPENWDGCSSSVYFTNKDRSKQENFVLFTDHVNARIRINGKFEDLKISGQYKWERQVFSNRKYLIIIQPGKRKDFEYEYYIMDALITIKQNSKIVYQKKLPADGGC